MKLKTLILQESEAAKKQKRQIPFRWLTHHLSEIYVSLLPDININNSSKITIEFGQQGDEVAFDAMFGCTNVFVEDFDFNKFYSSSPQERNMMLLDEITESLIAIYKRKGENTVDIQSIISTAEKVIETGFCLDTVIKKLQKTTKDKKQKIEIHRILNSEVGEAWKCLVMSDKDSFLLAEKWMTDVPDYLDRTDFFKNAEIKDGFYTIFNALGQAVFQIKID